MFNKYVLLIITILVFATTSCVKDFKDMTNVQNVQVTNLNGTYALPAIDQKLSLSEFIDSFDKRHIVKDNGSGFLSIIFDTLNTTIDISNIIKLENRNKGFNFPIPSNNISTFALLPIGSNDVLIEKQTFIDTLWLNDVLLDKIDFFDGYLKIIYPVINQDVTYSITFNDFSKNSQLLDVSKLVPANTQAETPINLKNYIWDLTHGGPTSNNVHMTVAVSATKTSNDPLPANINLKLGLSDMVYNKIDGFFGQKRVKDLNVRIPISLFKQNYVSGALQIESPKIKMHFLNDFKVPFKATIPNNTISIETNSGGTMDINGISIPEIKEAISNILPSNTNHDINTSNAPQLANAILNNPLAILATIQLEMNPLGNTGIKNSLKNTDKINIKTTLELPLSFKANNFKLYKTFDFPVSNYTSNDSNIEKIAIHFNLANSFPFDVSLQANFLDPTTNTPLRNLIPSSSLLIKHGDGTTAGTSEMDIIIPGDEWNLMAAKGVNKLKLNMTINSPTLNQFYQISKDMFIDTKIGAKVFLKAKF